MHEPFKWSTLWITVTQTRAAVHQRFSLLPGKYLLFLGSQAVSQYSVLKVCRFHHCCYCCWLGWKALWVVWLFQVHTIFVWCILDKMGGTSNLQYFYAYMDFLRTERQLMTFHKHSKTQVPTNFLHKSSCLRGRAETWLDSRPHRTRLMTPVVGCWRSTDMWMSQQF